MKAPTLLLLALLLCGTAACDVRRSTDASFNGDGDALSTEVADGADAESVPPQQGVLGVLTYNVAGLPQGLSGSNPLSNMPQISPLLNDYDLVLVQEDFAYHPELVADLSHPHLSIFWPGDGSTPVGDGLSRFSRSPFASHQRTAWPGCNGVLDCASDCLATKGFSFARHMIAPGVEIDVYNLHMEAGGCPADEAIRGQSVTQLLDALHTRSVGRAVIMAGDFNLHEQDPVDFAQLTELVGKGGFVDACWFTDCGDGRIDRVLVRSSETLWLTPISWDVPQQFVDTDGVDLSDHKPVAVRIRWQRAE